MEPQQPEAPGLATDHVPPPDLSPLPPGRDHSVMAGEGAFLVVEPIEEADPRPWIHQEWLDRDGPEFPAVAGRQAGDHPRQSVVQLRMARDDHAEKPTGLRAGAGVLGRRDRPDDARHAHVIHERRYRALGISIQVGRVRPECWLGDDKAGPASPPEPIKLGQRRVSQSRQVTPR